MSSPNPQQQSTVDADRLAIGPWQAWLDQFCVNTGLRAPVYSIASDRRGGRTAWSAAVEVNGTAFSARYWFDGNYITNAKEDAAQVALERLEPAQQHQEHKEQYQAYLEQLQQQVQQAQHHGQSPHSNQTSSSPYSQWSGYSQR